MFADSGFSSSSGKCVKEPTMCVWFITNFRCFTHMVLGTQINIIFRKTKRTVPTNDAIRARTCFNSKENMRMPVTILLVCMSMHALTVGRDGGLPFSKYPITRPHQLKLQTKSHLEAELDRSGLGNTLKYPGRFATYNVAGAWWKTMVWWLCQINLQHISAPVARTRLMVSTTLLTKFMRHTWTSDCWKTPCATNNYFVLREVTQSLKYIMDLAGLSTDCREYSLTKKKANSNKTVFWKSHLAFSE